MRRVMDQTAHLTGIPMSESWAHCYELPAADIFHKVGVFAGQCEREHRTGLSVFRRTIFSANRPRTQMLDRATGRSREVIMLGSNSYLGLTADPRVIEAAAAAARQYGYGMGSVALYAGTTDLHKELERRLAAWYGGEAALLFPSGYAANVGTLAALLRPGDVAINDLFNHASIYDGCRLSGATLRTFAHANTRHLERALRHAAAEQRGALVVTDGVFSMEGDVAPLGEIAALAQRFGARLMLDDSHALGVIGPSGRGTAELHGVEGRIDVTMCTLSKCLGGIGGCIVGSAALIEYLQFYARAYFFSAAIPAPVVAGALTALDIIEREPERRADLWQSIRYVRDGLRGMGFDTGQSESAIIPLIVGDEARLERMLLELIDAGIYMNYVAFPAVSRQRCRLRLSMMSGHTRSDLDYVVETLHRLGRKHGVIP